jgi:hypothetical protein
MKSLHAENAPFSLDFCSVFVPSLSWQNHRFGYKMAHEKAKKVFALIARTHPSIEKSALYP